ncbi:MAG TPA: hypothetical protein VMV43_04690 [Candidatus Nanopelagicaceae bacterium]|nr:hypothetical protein [Candidatus Nanopelagicaceae bacterium]
MEKEYLGFSITINNKKLFTVDKIRGKKYNLYEVIDVMHYNSLAIFRDEESVTAFSELMDKLLTNK